MKERTNYRERGRNGEAQRKGIKCSGKVSKCGTGGSVVATCAIGRVSECFIFLVCFVCFVFYFVVWLQMFNC